MSDSLKDFTYKAPDNYSFSGFIKIQNGILFTDSATPEVAIDFSKSVPFASIFGKSTQEIAASTVPYQDFDQETYWTFYFEKEPVTKNWKCSVYYGVASENPDPSNLYKQFILLKV